MKLLQIPRGFKLLYNQNCTDIYIHNKHQSLQLGAGHSNVGGVNMNRIYLYRLEHLLINLKDKFFEPDVGSLQNLARMCP